MLAPVFLSIFSVMNFHRPSTSLLQKRALEEGDREFKADQQTGDDL